MISELLSRVEILTGSFQTTTGTHVLISEREDDIDQEENSVNDGKRSFGDSERFTVAWSESDDLARSAVVPVLQDQDSRGDEQDCTSDGEEKICKNISC